MKRTLAIALAAALLLGAAGCTAQGQQTGTPAPQTGASASAAPAPAGDGHKYGGTLVVATKLEPSTFVSNYNWDGAIPYIGRNIFSKLVAYDDSTNELYGDLAESWSNSDDLMTYTFNLRQGVKWHDGESFTSADVKWTIDSILEMGDRAYGYSVLSAVERVEAPDDYTVVLHLSEPSGTMINNVADYYGFDILPKHLYEGTDVNENPCNTVPVGTGPFKFVEHVTGSHVTLEANPDYFGDGPYLDQVVFTFAPSETTAMTALEAGEAHFMTASPAFAEVSRLQSVSGLKVDMQPSTITQWMGFNMDGTRPHISDPVVREAIACAVNNEEIAQKLYMGLVNPATSWYTTLIGWADNTAVRQPAYDVAKANQLLDDAGYTKGSDGYRFSLVYRCFPTSIFGTTDIPNFVVQYLDAIGIKVEVQQYEWALRTEMLDNQRDWDMCSGGGDRGPDANNFASYLLSSSASNKMRYSNPEIDRLFAEGTQHAGEAERAPYYFQVQEIIAKDIPMFNFVEYGRPWVYSDQFTGFYWQADSGHSAQHMVNTVEWAGGTAG